jgi:hypothetical protein
MDDKEEMIVDDFYKDMRELAESKGFPKEEENKEDPDKAS